MPHIMTPGRGNPSVPVSRGSKWSRRTPKWVKFEFMWRDEFTVAIRVWNYVYRNSFKRIRLILCRKSIFYPFSSPFWDKKRAWDLKSPFGNEHPNFSQSTHPILWTSAEKYSKAWLFYGRSWTSTVKEEICRKENQKCVLFKALKIGLPVV